MPSTEYGVQYAIGTNRDSSVEMLRYTISIYIIQYTIIQLFNAHRAWVFLSILIILGVMYEILINKVPMIVSHITNTYIRSSTQEIGAEH